MATMIIVHYLDKAYDFIPTTSLAEMAEKLSAGDIEKRLCISFVLASDQSSNVIADDLALRMLVEKTEGNLALIAKLKLEKLVPQFCTLTISRQNPFASHKPESSLRYPKSQPERNYLSCRIAVGGVVTPWIKINLQHNIDDLMLFDVSKMIIESQGLNPSEHSCYLYNGVGWPLAMNIEQLSLIGAGYYLSDRDTVLGVITNERPQIIPQYIDPLVGDLPYTFDFSNMTYNIKLSSGCTIQEFRVRVMWLLRIPMKAISVYLQTEVIDLNKPLPDDFTINQSDIENRRLKIIYSFAEHIGKVDDMQVNLSEADLRKRYGYLYLLQKNLSPSLKCSFVILSSLLAQSFEPFFFALYLGLSDSTMTKSERVALEFGCSAMFSAFSSLVAEDSARDFGLMIALLHKIAEKSNDFLRKFLLFIEFASKGSECFLNKVSSDSTKANQLAYFLGTMHTTVPLLVVDPIKKSFSDVIAQVLPRTALTSSLLTSYQCEFSYLKILHPLDITLSPVQRLTFHPNGDLWITRGLKESCNEIGPGQDVILIDVLTEREELIKQESLSAAIKQLIPNLGRSIAISREPDEAVAVLIDTSSSMADEYSSGDKRSRMEAAKIFFFLFAQKTQSYNFHHVFALVTFSSAPSPPSEFTENVNEFMNLVERLEPRGATALFSAMKVGITSLVQFRTQYPRAKLRIIVISDGEDNRSAMTGKQISDDVNQHGIVVDVFAVGGNCSQLKLIAKRSGGYCYYTDTTIEGVRKFEAETIVKAGLRKKVENLYPEFNSEEDFINTANGVKFDTLTPPMEDSSVVGAKVCCSKRITELRLGQNVSNPSAARRIQRELACYSRDPHPNCSLFPLNTNMFVWRGIIEGPRQSPYEGGLFDFYLSFGEGYPGVAPEMRFLTPIFHPNITQNGKICHEIFKERYFSTVTIRTIINHVYDLLHTFELNDYIVSNLNITLKNDKNLFMQKAREQTEKYARSELSVGDKIKRMMVEDDCPDKYKCAYSGVIMRNPVYCKKSDKIYERSEIEGYIRLHGTDPLTGIPIEESDLSSEGELRQKIDRLYPQ